ncbi:O-antigen ligase [Methylophilus sp. TWE2]|uniref:O-antigen ligase family protein n=1 Tax=Methylophilus sp. TWE2 TaxID=1662285 RepID=UPI0006718114|nr:O-antigen ligase family protein [Methylophilus sp. TWE2]AKR43390.1 hypothetical protein ACJ67_08090 [Methylophilus sp. TWE2]
MAKLYKKEAVTNVIFAFMLGLFCLAFAGIILFFPPGFVVRLSLIIFAFFIIIIAWGLREKSNAAPNQLLIGLTTLVVVLSIVWPRYFFFNLGPLPKINPLTLTEFVTCIVIILSATYSPSFSSNLYKTIKNGGWIFKLAIIWLVWRLIANFLGEYPVSSVLEFMRETIFVSSFLLFGLVIASYDEGPKRMVHYILLAGFIVSFAGLVEAFQQKNYFVGFAPQDTDGELSKVIATITAEKIRSGAYRVQSTFDHPIVFSQFAAALIPMSIYGIFYGFNRFWRLLSFLILPITFLAIIKSGSRSGIASFVVAIAFMGALFWSKAIVHGKISKFVALLGIPILFVGMGIGAYILQELTYGGGHTESGSSSWRMVMINMGIKALWDSPFWGFGQGMAVIKAGITNSNGIHTIDSYLLTIALDSGYIGLILFLLLIVVFCFKGFKYAIFRTGDEGLFVGACVASCLALVTTFSILSIVNNMTLFWLLMASTFPYMGNKTKGIQ